MKKNDNNLKLLCDLISIRSDVDETSGKNESDLAAYVVKFFQKLSGWKVRKQKIAKNRYNIIATTSNNPKTVFFGHMDTVPVLDIKQLQPQKRGARLYGRGAVDMKSGLMLMLSLAQEKAWKDVALIFTVGEEYDLCGAEAFLGQYKDWKPELVINPEPTDLQLLTACRGIAEMKIRLRGKTAHAGRKRDGVSAIEGAVALCQKLEEKLQLRDEGNLRSSVNLASILGGVEQNEAIICRPNMVPDIADVFIELRLGCLDISSQSLKKIVSKIAIDCHLKLVRYEPGIWFMPLVAQRNRQLKQFTESILDVGLPVTNQDPNESGFFEVALLKKIWNCPCVVFGPGPFAKAHQSDEYVRIPEIAKTREVLVSYLIKTIKDEVQ